jgi:anti-anti-sigma factor
MTIAVISNASSTEATLSMDTNFDFNCVSEFLNAYEGVEVASGGHFIVDLRRTHYMDSSALGMLINMHKFLTEKNIDIRIINSSAQIRKIFTISRFDKRFQID